MMDDLKNYFDLLVVMTLKEVSARYKKAVFGFLWVILNPILQMLVIGFVFSFFVNIPNYFLFLFTGLLPWQFFSLSLNKTTGCFVNQRSLLQKSKFPREVIPLSIIFSNFIHLVISLVLFLLFLVIIGNLPTGFVVYLIPALIWLLFVTIGVSLVASTLNVRFRDVGFAVRALTTLWFYATPILYSLDLIPAHFHRLFGVNPLASIFEVFHLSLLGRGQIIPNILIFNLLISLLVIVFGVYIFRKNQHSFVDWI